MPRSRLFALIILASLPAAACQPASTRQAAPAANVAAVTSATEAPGCAGEIARYRTVMANDLATGNVGRQVHDKISREIERAGTACSAGLDTEAVAIIRITKAQHGYR